MSSNRRDFLKGSVAAAAAGGLGSIADHGRAAESSNDEVIFQRRITVRHEVDVFVAGGGPAGVAAAVAAARQGARVFLAERNTCLGGMGTAGMLPLFMPFTDGVHMLAGGIGADIQRRLKENDGTGPGSDVTIRAEVLKRVYDDLLVEASVQFQFHTDLIAVEADSGQSRRSSCRARAACSPSRLGCSSTAPATATWRLGPGPRSRRATSTAT